MKAYKVKVSKEQKDAATKNRVLTAITCYGDHPSYNGVTIEQIMRKVAGLEIADLNEAIAALIAEGVIEETDKE